MKLQASEASNLKSLQSQNTRSAENRIWLSVLEVVHGRLVRSEALLVAAKPIIQPGLRGIRSINSVLRHTSFIQALAEHACTEKPSEISSVIGLTGAPSAFACPREIRLWRSGALKRPCAIFVGGRDAREA